MDAKRLVTRLREHDNAADALISETNGLHLKLEAMKQVCYCIKPVVSEMPLIEIVCLEESWKSVTL